MNITGQENIQKFQEKLLNWFEENQRDHLPWRQTTNPYEILLAEKLLQQTSVRQLVIDAYLELLEQYPTIGDLAEADPEKIKTIIHSLGFHYRAYELVSMAQEIVSQHDGKIPDNLDDLKALTGVGPYCARAVLSFAFNGDIAVVDVNVGWFLHRVFGLEGKLPSSPATSKKLRQVASQLLPDGKAKEFNWAILDLCAEICTRRNPHCEICPINEHCAYGISHLTS